MPTFGELRDRVTPQVREVLDFTWENYLTKGEWPTNRVIFGKFKKETFLGTIGKLDGSLIREVDAPNGQKAFQLLLLGILSTSRGGHYLSLIERYAEFMRDIFFHQSSVDAINQDDVRTKLELSSEDTAMLGRLVFSGFLQANGGYQPGFTAWGSSIPHELEDFPSDGPTTAAVMKILDRMASSKHPVLLADRIASAGQSLSNHPAEEFTAGLQDENSKEAAVFLSYSHDSKEHKIWILELAQRLHLEKIGVIFDQWDLGPGDDVVKFMERSVTRADRVLMICTEAYVRKVNEGQGGAGYEGTVVTGELIKNLGTAKFIPIIRQAGTHLVPNCVSTGSWIDLSTGADIEEEVKRLISSLRREPPPTKPSREDKNPKAPTMPLKSPPLEPVASATTAAHVAKSIPGDALAVYEQALTLAQNRDLVRWRKLLASVKGDADEALREWRSSAEQALPKLKSELPAFALKGVATQQSLFAMATAGVESGEPRFNRQTSLIYDLIKPTGWQSAGYSLICEFPEANAFVFQAIIGSMCVYSAQNELAIDLATQRVTNRFNSSKSGPLFLDHSLTAWPTVFETTATIAWKFLGDLPDHFPWIAKAFGSADSYRQSLSGYFLLLAWLEFVVYLKSNPSLETAPQVRLEVPPLFLRTPRFSASMRHLLADRAVIVEFGNKQGVSVDQQLKIWPTWYPQMGKWLENVFHDYDSEWRINEIANFANDVHGQLNV